MDSENESMDTESAVIDPESALMEIKTNETIQLITSDSEVVEWEFNFAFNCSKMISKICDERGYDAQTPDMRIELPRASKRALESVVRWAGTNTCDQLVLYDEDLVVESTLSTDDIPQEDIDFLEKLTHPGLFEIILVSSYMEIPRLLESSSKFIAGMIKGKGPQGIRDTFNIPNDFSPGEEEKIRKENEWCQEI